MVRGNYDLCVDWGNDGSYLSTYDDITSDVIGSISCFRGRETPVTLPGIGYCGAGQLEAELLNTSGKYSSLNASSPIYGSIKTGRPVRLRQAGYDALVLKDGATTYWRLGEASGLIADSAGTLAGGTAVNCTFGVAGALTNDSNTALSLNGSSSYILWADDTALKLGDVFTIEAWVRRAANGANHVIIDKQTNDYRLYLTSGNALRLDKGNVSTIVTSTTTITDTNWHHCVCTKNGSAVKLYIDGVDVTGTVNNATIGTTTNTVVVGAFSAASGWFNGRIDEIALYKNVVLTAAQVLTHYQAQTRYPTATLWTGYLDRIEPEAPAIGVLPKARLVAFGPLSRLTEKKVSPPAQNSGALTGTIAAAILDEAGVTNYSAEAGKTTTSRWYTHEKPALEALRELEDTEAGFVCERADGYILFQDRHHRLVTAASTTSQATFSDAAGATLGYNAITMVNTQQALVNEVTALVPTFSVASSAVVWTLAESGVEIGPGATKAFIAEYPNRGNSQGAYVDTWTTPVPGTDIISSNVDAATYLDVATVFASSTAIAFKTPNTMRISIRNTHPTNTAVLTLVQARGTAVTFGDPVRVLSENAASKTAHGRRSYEFPGKWLPSSTVAQSYADYLVAGFASPVPALSLTYRANLSGSHLTQAMNRELSDRITVRADGVTQLGLNQDWFIERIEHRIEAAGTRHTVTYGLSPANAASYWILGTSALDTGTILAF